MLITVAERVIHLKNRTLNPKTIVEKEGQFRVRFDNSAVYTTGELLLYLADRLRKSRHVLRWIPLHVIALHGCKGKDILSLRSKVDTMCSY